MKIKNGSNMTFITLKEKWRSTGRFTKDGADYGSIGFELFSLFGRQFILEIPLNRDMASAVREHADDIYFRVMLNKDML